MTSTILRSSCSRYVAVARLSLLATKTRVVRYNYDIRPSRRLSFISSSLTKTTSNITMSFPNDYKKSMLANLSTNGNIAEVCNEHVVTRYVLLLLFESFGQMNSCELINCSIYTHVLSDDKMTFTCILFFM